jgi:hypothetical protein
MSRCETILYTPYYRAASERRQAELDRCLRENVACREIDRIVLLIDDGSTPPVDDPKIELVSIRRRPSYGDWLELAARRTMRFWRIRTSTSMRRWLESGPSWTGQTPSSRFPAGKKSPDSSSRTAIRTGRRMCGRSGPPGWCTGGCCRRQA